VNLHVCKLRRTIYRWEPLLAVSVMNLNRVHKILRAATDQPYGFLKVNGRHLAREIELMAAAGLVEASPTVHGLETFAVIKRVTSAGHSFLRAFKEQTPTPSKTREHL
jgi:hypothetical protein